MLPSTWLCEAKLPMSEVMDVTLSCTASNQQVADLTLGCLAPVLGLFLMVFLLINGLLLDKGCRGP